MKEINKLEEYLQERSEKRKKRNRLLAFAVTALAVGAIGYAGVWGYSQYNSSQATVAPTVVQPERKQEEPRHLNENPPVILEEGENVFPSLSIEGNFQVGKPLDFVIKNYDGNGRHFIDFGDRKNMTIKNMTKHVYRKAGEYKIKFKPADSEEVVIETINIQKRDVDNENDKHFVQVIESLEANQARKAFVNLNLDSNASFPGGTTALMAYLQTRIGDVSGYQGRVLVSFMVKKDGSIDELKVVDSVNKKLDSQVLPAFNGMPKWNPAVMDGVEVDSEYQIPFYFSKES